MNTKRRRPFFRRVGFVLSFAVTLLAFIVILRGSLSSPRPQSPQLDFMTFQCGHGRISEDAIPALVAYHKDHGRFPLTDDGWAALFNSANGRAPYIRPFDSYGDSITLPEFLGLPKKEYEALDSSQAVRIHVQPIKSASVNWPGLDISLKRLSVMGRELSDEEAKLFRGITNDLVALVINYRRSHGCYPSAVFEANNTRSSEYVKEHIKEHTLIVTLAELDTCRDSFSKFGYWLVGSPTHPKGFAIRLYGKRPLFSLPKFVVTDADLFDKQGDIEFVFLETDDLAFDTFVAKRIDADGLR